MASVTSPASSEHDELFLSPLDFGPSLSESVFSELNDSTAQRAAAGSTGAPGATTGAIPKNIHSVKAAVSASLYRSDLLLPASCHHLRYYVYVLDLGQTSPAC